MSETSRDEMRDEIRASCEKQGVSWATAQARERVPEQAVIFHEWVDEFNRKEVAERDAATRQYVQDALASAQQAAVTSERAALAANDSANWTMWAAIASAAGVLLNLAHILGWLGKAG